MTLQGLKKQFNAQLEDATDKENAQQAAHDNFISEQNSLQAENSLLLASAEKTMESTDDRVDKANGIIDHEGLQDMKDELATTTESCAFAEKSYNEHSMLRQDEAAAVSEAMEMLGSDDSKDLFNALDAHADREMPVLLQIKATLKRVRIHDEAPVSASAG